MYIIYLYYAFCGRVMNLVARRLSARGNDNYYFNSTIVKLDLNLSKLSIS